MHVFSDRSQSLCRHLFRCCTRRSPPPGAAFLHMVVFVLVFFTCMDGKFRTVMVLKLRAKFASPGGVKPYQTSCCGTLRPSPPRFDCFHGLAKPRIKRSATSTLDGCARPCLAWKDRSTRGCATRSCRRWCFPGAQVCECIWVCVLNYSISFARKCGCFQYGSTVFSFRGVVERKQLHCLLSPTRHPPIC